MTTLRQVIITIFVAGASLPTVPADTVKLRDKPAFEHVRIGGYRDGRLTFRGVSQEYLHRPLGEVEWLDKADCPALGRAERAAADNHWDDAVAGYAAALESAAEPWLRELVRVRLMQACDRAGRFDEAVAQFIELLHSAEPVRAGTQAGRAGPGQVNSVQPNRAFAGRNLSVAAGLLAAYMPKPDLFRPSHPGPVGSAVNARAIEQVREELRHGAAKPVIASLRTLLLELCIYEDVPELPPELTSAGPQSRPAITPLLGLAVPAPKAPELPLLPAGSFLLGAAEAAVSGGQPGRALELIEPAMRQAPPADAGWWRLLHAEALLAADRLEEATAEFLDIGRGSPDPVIAAGGLYYAAVAQERLGRADLARQLLGELLGRDNVPEEIRRPAASDLRRLGD